jgi:hypothetical protein
MDARKAGAGMRRVTWMRGSLVGGLVALATAGGCGNAGTGSAGTVSEQLAAMPSSNDALIQMRRGGCGPGGQCPIYSVSIFTDGTVTYDGRANVATIGQRRAKLSCALVNELISAIDAMHFLDSAEQCCVCPEATGSALVILDYRPGAIPKTVFHDQGCRSAPAAMSALEEAIDRTAEVERWTKPVLARKAPPVSDSPKAAALEGAPVLLMTSAEPTRAAPQVPPAPDPSRSDDVLESMDRSASAPLPMVPAANTNPPDAPHP